MTAALEEMIDELFSMIQDAKSVPLSSDKCIIERERALDVLEELRASLPSDLKMAKDIVEKRNDVIAAGKREAETLKAQADEYVKKVVNQQNVVQEANRRAAELVGNAEIQSRELRRVANEYCEDTLKRAEETVMLALDEIKNAHKKFRTLAANHTAKE